MAYDCPLSLLDPPQVGEPCPEVAEEVRFLLGQLFVFALPVVEERLLHEHLIELGKTVQALVTDPFAECKKVFCTTAFPLLLSPGAAMCH